MSDPSRQNRPISLGGRIFDVPPLPLGVTIFVYPICRRLSGAIERLFSAAGGDELQLTAEEMGDLTELAFQGARVADPDLDAQAFLALPVTPPELFAAFFAMRVQCGGWRSLNEEDAPAGEGEGVGVA